MILLCLIFVCLVVVIGNLNIILLILEFICNILFNIILLFDLNVVVLLLFSVIIVVFVNVVKFIIILG